MAAISNSNGWTHKNLKRKDKISATDMTICSSSPKRAKFEDNPPEKVVTKKSSNLLTCVSNFVRNTFLRRKRHRTEKLNELRGMKEKQRYEELLSRHTKPSVEPHLSATLVRTPPIIDLTLPQISEVSRSNRMNGSEPLFRTETLDTNEKISLLSRLRNKGLCATATCAPNKFECTIKLNHRSSLPFNQFSSSKHSTPKYSLFYQNPIQTLPKTPESSEKSAPSLPSLPSTSKKFNDLIHEKSDLWSDSFVSDLRNSLPNESLNRRILKSESILNEYQIKRQTDCQSFNGYFKTPITRTELLPFIPYIAYDDRIEDSEEEEDEEEETAPSDIPDLTPDMNKEIDSALRPTPPNEVLVEGFTVQICRKDMETLKGLNWLNDEIINFYLALIVERGKNDNFPTVHAFNTFFYKKLKDNGPQSLKRWTRKVDVFANDFIFIPIHLGMHWCLAVIDFVNKRIEYYDSMGGNNNDCLQSLKAWLQAESLDKKRTEFPMSEWVLQNMAKDIPQQMNGSDCGMFSCKYAEYIARKAKINFSQAHMPYFRRRMVYEILTKQLL